MEFYNTNINHHSSCTRKNNQEFLNLQEYLELSEILIRKFFPSYGWFIKDEDKISYIAEKIMIADWCYDPSKNKARKSHRWDRGIWAIKELIRIIYNQKQKNLEQEKHLRKIHSEKSKNLNKEFKDKQIIKEILETPSLSVKEKMAIKLIFLEKNSDESAASIMKMSHSMVNLHKNRGLKKLRQKFSVYTR